MARRARTVFRNVAHHVTQRGNYRQDVFFSDDDRRRYLAWLDQYSRRYGLEIWAYCLMTNHVHLLAVPRKEDSLARTLAATHMRHAQAINAQRQSAGHLWQGRFYSCPLDEGHLITAVRYIERNPVRARLKRRAEHWPWSSARAHLRGEADPLLEKAKWPPPDLRASWAQVLGQPDPEEEIEALRRQTYTGRPWGGAAFVKRLERLAGKPLQALPRGRPSKEKGSGGK